MLTFSYLIEQNIIINNEYFKKYIKLIEANKDTKKEKFKTQIHHIIPKHIFKNLNLELDDSTVNKVNLTFSDHALAHYYLANCTTGVFLYSNICALNHILGVKYFSENEKTFIKNLPNLENLYVQAMKIQSEKTHKNKKGIKFTEDHKKKMSEANKGRIYVNNGEIETQIKPEKLEEYLLKGFKTGRKYKHSEETKKKIGSNNKGRKHTWETRQKIKEARKKQVEKSGEPGSHKKTTEQEKQKSRERMLGSRWMHKDNTIKHILKKNISEYIADGWKFGRYVEN